MSEQPQAQQPEQAQAGPDTSGTPVAPGAGAGEDMARKLVEDVAAYEVDPPPPARVQATEQARDQASGQAPEQSR